LFLLTCDTYMISRTVASIGNPDEPLRRARLANLPDEASVYYAYYLEDLNPARFAYNDQMDQIADEALRAGVVIHTMNLRGLSGDGGEVFGSTGDRPGGGYPFNTGNADFRGGEGLGWGAIAATARVRTAEFIPLSKKTGGLFVQLSNFFIHGIGSANEMLKGYYLLTYAPPPNTFKSNNRYHHLKVKVARPGSRVHARDGFLGTADTSEEKRNSRNALFEAMHSPFRYGDLPVALNCGYAEDPQKGYLLQTWVHLDGRNLSLVDEKDGTHTLSLEILAATDNSYGEMQEAGKSQRKVPIADAEIPMLRKHGIGFPLAIPAKKPGSYFVRAAIRDVASGKVGSAYKFIEIPDLSRGRLSLSSIFTTATDSAGTSARIRYHAGEDIEYTAMIYNAKSTPEKTPDLESQLILYVNGRELSRSDPESIGLENESDPNKIPIKKMWHLENSLQPGNYELQLLVKDKQAKTSANLAVQTLEFEISAE
jgi:hypothetical protein